MNDKHKFNPDLLDALFEEDAISAMDIRPDTIKKRVREKLNIDKAEEAIFMRYQITRIAVLLIALFSMGTMTAFAMTRFDILKDIFFGDTELVEEFIYESGESMENGEFRITLDQTISDYYGIMVVYSVEALTDDAEAALNDHMFMAYNDVIIDFPESEEVQHDGIGGGNLPEYDTPRKKYYTVQVKGMNGLPENSRLRTNILGPEYIESSIPLPKANRLESYDIEINRMVQSTYDYTVYNVGFSSISLVIELGHDTQADKWGLEDPEIYFRDIDGHIVTKNQLIDFGSREGSGSKDSYVYYYRLKKPVDWTKYTSVIVADMEYPLDGGLPIPYTIPDGLKSFLFVPDMNEETLLRCPVEDFCKELGAEYRFDEATGKLFIKWRGTTFETVIGSETCQINGIKTPFNAAAEDFSIKDGRLICIGQFFRDIFDLDINWVGAFEEDLDAQRLWLVTP